MEEDKEQEEGQIPVRGNRIDYLGTDQKINSTHYMLTTKAFPVTENHVYNYSATIKGGKVPIRSVIADFRSSKDVIENSTRYGNNASDGRVLSMNPGSEIETTLEILRPSNYTIGLRAKTCEGCTFLRIELEGNKYDKNFIVFTNKVIVPLNMKQLDYNG